MFSIPSLLITIALATQLTVTNAALWSFDNSFDNEFDYSRSYTRSTGWSIFNWIWVVGCILVFCVGPCVFFFCCMNRQNNRGRPVPNARAHGQMVRAQANPVVITQAQPAYGAPAPAYAPPTGYPPATGYVVTQPATGYPAAPPGYPVKGGYDSGASGI